MSNTMTKEMIIRSPRIMALPEKFSSYVSYRGQDGEDRSGQFADFSASGMRIVSRKWTKCEVDDKIAVEFSLPGVDGHLLLKAKIVRKMSEFVFAVRFIELTAQQSIDLKKAIEQHLIFRRWRLALHPVLVVTDWFQINRKGVMIALAGTLVFAFAASKIYVNSDEHNGAQLKSWGKEYPKSWYTDYYKHYSK
jgi:hypothetical protein